MIGSDPRYQSIIDAYRAGEMASTAPQYNPIYDIRREQIGAGELEEGARFPRPQLDTTPAPVEEGEGGGVGFDPCPPGYQLIDGVCQPNTMFDQSGGGDGGPELPPRYYGDINLEMAGGFAPGDPNVPYGGYRVPDATVNTELMRLAAQSGYQPTIGTDLANLGRSLYQNIGFGLLNAIAPYAPTQQVTPRQSILDAVAAEQAAQLTAEQIAAQEAQAALQREGQQLRAELTRDQLDRQSQSDRAKAQGAGSFTVGTVRKPIKGTGYDPSKASKSIAGTRLRGGI